MKYLQNVRNTMAPRSAVLLAVALLGTGFAARAYRRRKKQCRPGTNHEHMPNSLNIRCVPLREVTPYCIRGGTRNRGLYARFREPRSARDR